MALKINKQAKIPIVVGDDIVCGWGRHQVFRNTEAIHDLQTMGVDVFDEGVVVLGERFDGDGRHQRIGKVERGVFEHGPDEVLGHQQSKDVNSTVYF